MAPEAFTNLLPPFPVVGELCVGTNSLHLATNLMNRPDDKHWSHARLILRGPNPLPIARSDGGCFGGLSHCI